MSDEPTFDLESVYYTEIAPLMARVIAACETHGMPMLATFCYRNGVERGATICTTRLPRGDWMPDALRAADRELFRKAAMTAFTVTRAKPDDRA